MDFCSAINSMMKDVNDGSTEPFIIFRSNDGEWHCEYTQNQFGATLDWAEDIKTRDPFYVEYSGEYFSKGSYAFVYDTVFLDRLRAEYSFFKNTVEEGLIMDALASFFEENVTEFSQEVTDYLTTLERPLAAIKEMCPLDMVAHTEDEYYNEDLAEAAIAIISNAARERLHIQAEKPEAEKSAQGGYIELHKISINDSDIHCGETSRRG